MDEEGHRRRKEQGCKVWYVDAEELESKIKDLIIQERTSDDFVREVRALIEERDTFPAAAQEAVETAEMGLATAKREVAVLGREIANLARMLAATGVDVEEGEGESDRLAEALVAARQRVRTAEAELEKARTFARSKEDAWARFSEIIHESRNLAAAWARSGLTRRCRRSSTAASPA